MYPRKTKTKTKKRMKTKVKLGNSSIFQIHHRIDGEWKHGEGLSCLIFMEAWTNGGQHQICWLPCGHLYGFTCIKKWLQQRRSSGKCPQCNRTCSLRDVGKIFASRIAAAFDDEAQKRILYLEAKLSST